MVGVDWSTVDGLTWVEVQCTNKGDGNGWSTEERGRQIYFRSSFTKAVAHSLRCRQASLSRRDRAASGHLQAQLGGRGHREVSGLRSNRRAKGARNVTHSQRLEAASLCAFLVCLGPTSDIFCYDVCQKLLQGCAMPPHSAPSQRLRRPARLRTAR